jgi:hypothetical protein
MNPRELILSCHGHAGSVTVFCPRAQRERKIQPAFTKVGITGLGWHTFRHYVELQTMPISA